MVKKFKCLSCSRVFEAEEGTTNCPVCGSENITPDTGKSSLWLIICAVVLGCAILGFGSIALMRFVFERGNEQTSVITADSAPVLDDGVPGDGNQEESEAQAEVTTPASIPAFVGDPKPVLSGTKYKFTVVAETESGDAVEYFLLIVGETDPSYTSKDGRFEDVMPSPDGIYTVVAVNVVTGESAEKAVAGFVRVESKPIARVSAAELERIFNGGRIPADFRSKIVTSYKLNFTGLAAGEPRPDRYEEIINRICGGAWDSVNVTSVTYNDLGQVTSIGVKINQ